MDRMKNPVFKTRQKGCALHEDEKGLEIDGKNGRLISAKKT
jgi:hypothetical protein